MGIQAADLTTAAATQISRPESLDAKHNVTIGSNPPVRLDKISARHIPFLGFKTATRIEKEQAGIVTQLSHVADALLAPNIDAKALLTSLATVQGYCDKLVASSKSANPSKPVDVDATIMVLGSEAFAKLPNEKMQALFDKLVSKDFDALRRAIAFEARTNPALRTKMLFALSALSALEAAVVSDISSRVVSSHNTPAQAADGPQPGAHESTVALETGVSLSLKGEKESAMADAERAPQRKIMGGATVSAQQIADKMRTCELTINLDPELFVGRVFDSNGKPLATTKDGHLVVPEGALPGADGLDFSFKNCFELPKRPGAEGYMRIREKVEDTMFPVLGTDGTTADRPVYGALNIADKALGPAQTYGKAVIVFKDSVKQSATYTYGDTFDILRIDKSDKARQSFIDSLLSCSKISEETKQNLRDGSSAIRKHINAIFSGPFTGFSEILNSKPYENLLDCVLLTKDASTDPDALIQDLLADSAVDRKAQASHPVTFSNLEALIPKMNVPAQVMLEAAVGKATSRLHLMGHNYIEAQLLNRPVFSRDVAEIRIPFAPYNAFGQKLPKTVIEDAQKFAEDWSARTGVKLTLVPNGTISQEAKEIGDEVGALKKTLSDSYKLTDYKSTLVRSHVRAFLSDEKRLRQAIRDQDPDGKIAKLVGNDYFDPKFATFKDVLADKLTMAVRTEINAMVNVGDADCEEAIAKAFPKAFASKKAVMHLIADEFEFERPDEKAIFTKWAMSCKLTDVGEARLIYASMKKFHALILDIASGKLADPAAIEKALAEFAQSVERDVPAFVSERLGKGDFGLPDRLSVYSRSAKLVVDFLGVSDLPTEAKEKVFAAFCSPRMDAFAAMCARSVGEVTDGEMTSELQGASALSTCIDYFRSTLADLLGKPQPPEIRGNQPFSSIPQSERKIFTDVFPGAGAFIDKIPAPPERPLLLQMAAPTDPALATGKLADRRGFLLKCLPEYLQKELPGDVSAGTSKGFDRGRDSHGRTHAIRTFIFANVLANILKEKGVQVDVDAVARLAAGHDLGRTHDGKDTEEKQSAERTCRLLGNAGQDHLDDATAAIDSTDENPPSIEAYILHCADSLDYGRVGTIDKQYFPFLRECLVLPDGTSIKIDEKLRDQLIKEATELVCQTHPFAKVQHDFETGKYDLETETGRVGYMQALKDAEGAICRQTDNVSDEQLLGDIEHRVLRENEIQPIASKRTFPLLSKYYHD